MGAELLSGALTSTGEVLAGVSAADLEGATPCASWRVRELINHIVGGQTFFATVATTGEPPSGGSAGEAPDFSAGDFKAAFAEGSARCMSAFEADGAMERIMKLPFGEMPGSAFVIIASSDTFTHGWDLAKATGQSTDLNPELAAQLLTFAQGFLLNAWRGPEGQAPFGPKVEAPAGASAADQLAAFLGRQP
jgi:uncharacterized protein (TIGR03086 family)